MECLLYGPFVPNTPPPHTHTHTHKPNIEMYVFYMDEMSVIKIISSVDTVLLCILKNLISVPVGIVEM
jgi:hypothetical protein